MLLRNFKYHKKFRENLILTLILISGFVLLLCYIRHLYIINQQAKINRVITTSNHR